MEETAVMLREGSPSSLMVLDELGRGTSTFDGYAIAHAVVTHLAMTTRPPRVLFATHYHMLTEEFAAHPRVALMHMAALVDAASYPPSSRPRSLPPQARCDFPLPPRQGGLSQVIWLNCCRHGWAAPCRPTTRRGKGRGI